MNEPAEVVSLLQQIKPAFAELRDSDSRAGVLPLAIKRNVDLAAGRLSRVSDLRKSIEAGKLRISGAVYDMHTGTVSFLPTRQLNVESRKPDSLSRSTYSSN